MGNCQRNRISGQSLDNSLEHEDCFLLKNEKIVNLTYPVLYKIQNKSNFLSFKNYKDTKNPTYIEEEININKDSFKLIKDSESCYYGILFTSDFKYDAQVFVYFFSYELIDTKDNTLNICTRNEKYIDPVILNISQGDSQLITIAPCLKISNYNQSELHFDDKRTFPVIIVIKTINCTSMNYFKIEGESLIKLRENY